MSLRVAPITIKAACRFVAHVHRHLPRVAGGLFATSVIDEHEAVMGVAIVSLPPARADMDGWTCEVVRCAAIAVEDGGAKNSCSLLYSTCRRVAQLLGYRRCLTKTLPEEGGGKPPRAGHQAARPDARRGMVAPLSKASAGRAP